MTIVPLLHFTEESGLIVCAGAALSGVLKISIGQINYHNLSLRFCTALRLVWGTKGSGLYLFHTPRPLHTCKSSLCVNQSRLHAY